MATCASPETTLHDVYDINRPVFGCTRSPRSFSACTVSPVYPIYDDARELAPQLGEGLSRSSLQRRLRIGYRQARQIMDRLVVDGYIASPRHERQALLNRALSAYARALAGCAIYEISENYPATSRLARHGWSSHQDAAQAVRDARETAVFTSACCSGVNSTVRSFDITTTPAKAPTPKRS